MLVVGVPACDDKERQPISMWSPGERFDAKVDEYRHLVGLPLVKVVAADTGKPVPEVFVGLTLIGPDGGDGGYQEFLTGSDGVAPRWLRLYPGRYQYHIRPHPDSRYANTEWPIVRIE